MVEEYWELGPGSGDDEATLEELMHPLSRCAMSVETFVDDTKTGTATAFLYHDAGRTWLLTAGHVITAHHPDDGRPLGTMPPTRLVVHPVGRANRLQFVPFPNEIALYGSDHTATWCRHPDGLQIDVAAIPIDTFDTDLLTMPVNDERLDSVVLPFNYRAGSTAFVLGYPDAVAEAGLPIWKRATVASEPSITGPTFLIDTATRHGMSGAPVFVQHTSMFERDGTVIYGTFYRFAGLYAARVLADEIGVLAQLGRVFKLRTLLETIRGGVPGNS